MMFPRQSERPTIILVEEMVARATDPKRILDLCCGDGWIARRIKKAFPAAEVWASDCVSVSRQRVQNPGIKFVKSDLFNSPEFDGIKFDLIVADPPYLPNGDWVAAGAPEPKIAFTDGSSSGFDIVGRIAEEGPAYLNVGGAIGIEIYPTHASKLRKLGWEILNDDTDVERFTIFLKKVN